MVGKQFLRSSIVVGCSLWLAAALAHADDSGVLAGVVTDAQGQPAKDAQVVMLKSGADVEIHNGHVDGFNSRNYALAKTDQEGHFKITGGKAPLVMAVMHDTDGYAEIFTDHLSDSFSIQLQPWAKIEGQLLIGDKPAANEPVSFGQTPALDSNKVQMPTAMLDDPTPLVQLIFPNRKPPDLAADPTTRAKELSIAQHEIAKILRTLKVSRPRTMFSDTKTDAEGRFKFDRVVPGRIEVSRGIVHKNAVWISTMPSHKFILDLAPGEVAHVMLGGTGRPVIGHIEVPLAMGKAFDWSAQQLIWVSLQPPPQERPTTGYVQTYNAATDGKGNFRVDNVLPSDYQLGVQLTPPPINVGNVIQQRESIGIVKVNFTIPKLPEGQKYSDEPIDLGTIKPTMTPRLNIGDDAPAIKLKALDGSEFSLADLKGKVVLIDFWAVRKKRSDAELPELAKLYAEQKDNPNFVMLGVAVEKQRKPIDDFIAEKKIDWRQAQLSDGLDNPLCKEIGMDSVPLMLLIGADGKVWARTNTTSWVQTIIGAALQDVPKAK